MFPDSFFFPLQTKPLRRVSVLVAALAFLNAFCGRRSGRTGMFFYRHYLFTSDSRTPSSSASAVLARGCAGGKLLFFCQRRFKFRPVSEEAQTFPPQFDGMKKKKKKREKHGKVREHWRNAGIKRAANVYSCIRGRGRRGGGGGEIIRMTFSARRRSPAVSSAGCSFGGTSLNINMAALI